VIGGEPLESLLKRDRLLLLAAIGSIAALAWIYMIREARAMSFTGVCECMGMEMSGPDAHPWSPTTIFPLFLMWAEMMVAMMLPSAAPMILMFSSVTRNRRLNRRPYVPVTFFLGGYLIVWTLFSAAAALAQWLLHGTALLSANMATTNRILSATLLIVAGVFQWTPLKNACLSHCQSPLSFLMTSWREGKSGALVMGLKHGLYCTGCCWMLMALLFVAGVMNLFWIAALTVFVLLEKVLPSWMRFERFAGVALVTWGLRVAVR
jgi:predicted metal-binding membrane protein